MNGAAIVILLIALGTLLTDGAIRIRAANIERNKVHPITPKRWRELNVVDRCNYGLACAAKYHEPTCMSIRKDAPQ